MCFQDQKNDSVSAGRKSRRCTVKELLNVRILADVSSVEVFLNDGEQVFSTRYYPEKYSAWWRGQMQKSHSGSFKRTSEKRDFTFKLGKVIIQNRTRAAANYI